MTCADVTLRVDAEGPDGLPDALRAHAAACARCAALLRAEHAIRDAVLATPGDLAPDLDARILDRVAREIRRARAPRVDRSRVPSLWETVSTAPSLAAAFALAGALMVWGDDLWRSLLHVNGAPIARVLAPASGGVPIGAWCACLTLWPLAALLVWGIAHGPRARPRGT